MKLIVLSILALGLAACSSTQVPLATVKNFDPQRYDGEWHEVARLPNRFEAGLVAAKATYQSQPKGPLLVHNKGLKADGETTHITGAATITGDGKLKVRFDPFPAKLFAGDYWILWINEGYTKAIVGSPSRKFLWLLSKNPHAQAQDFTQPLKGMKEQGFEIERLIENPKRLSPDATIVR